MQTLSRLSNELLHAQTIQAASNEKSATLVLLEHLAEVDRRRLHIARGYSGLWEYVHKALGYSEAQASDRVNALRAIRQVPEIRTELEAGRLTLTSTAKLGTHLRRERLAPAETLSLMQEISGKSSREVERVLVAHSTQAPQNDRLRVLTPELTRITLEVDLEFLALMNRAKELKGNPALTPQEIFKSAMAEYVKRREVREDRVVLKEHAGTHPRKTSGNGLTLPTTRAPALRKPGASTSLRSRYLSVEARNATRRRSGDRCEYVDPQTNRRCECLTGLQFDHIQPFAKGGSNGAKNLRHLCAAHNRFAAIQEYGETAMMPFLAG